MWPRWRKVQSAQNAPKRWRPKEARQSSDREVGSSSCSIAKGPGRGDVTHVSSDVISEIVDERVGARIFEMERGLATVKQSIEETCASTSDHIDTATGACGQATALDSGRVRRLSDVGAALNWFVFQVEDLRVQLRDCAEEGGSLVGSSDIDEDSYVRIGFARPVTQAFFEGRPVAQLVESGGEEMKRDSEHASVFASVQSIHDMNKSLIQAILYDMSLEPDAEILLEAARRDLFAWWTDSRTDSHMELFKRSAILSGVSGLGVKTISRLVLPASVIPLLECKRFVYPYVVSKKFRYLMFTLSQSVATASSSQRSNGSLMLPRTDIVSWESPKLLEIIQDSWRSWNAIALSEALLCFLRAEAVTAVSTEDDSVSTIVCGQQVKAVIRVEQSLAKLCVTDQPDMAWDSAAVLEVLLHEFCRIWRRMVIPGDVALTPRGIGSVDEPNAGDLFDKMLWGPNLSTDVRVDNVLVCERENMANLRKVLDADSWDNPQEKFFWRGGKTAQRRNGRRRRLRKVSANRLFAPFIN